MSDNSFTLDGQPVPFKTGQTIMDAALAADIYIPHLCHQPGYQPHGSCRLCLVEIDGRTVSACTQPALAGQIVRSVSEDLQAERKQLLQLLFIEGNHICPACEKSGACKLQALAYDVGMLESGFEQFFPASRIDASHADFLIDFNRCIACELCVRASRDIDGKAIFAISGRGGKRQLQINSNDGLLGSSNLSGDDAAAHICPVGAILPKHKAFRQPVGQRLYDLQPISQIDDVKPQEKAHGK